MVMRRRTYVGHGLQATCVEARNRRPYHEDRFGCALDVDGTDVSVIGVFDGHGGAACAEKAVSVALKALHSVALCAGARTIHGAVLSTDEDLLKDKGVGRSGCTMCAVMIYPADKEGNRDCWLINVGDSRCYVALHDGGAVRKISEDHKPTDDKETRRVLAAGGTVMGGRIWGSPGEPTCGLNLSRSLGDAPDKDRSMPPECRRVSCEPQIRRLTLGRRDTLFLMSDGMYEMDLLNDLARDMRAIHARGFVNAASSIGASVQRQLRRADDNLTMAAVFPLDPSATAEISPKCDLLLPSVLDPLWSPEHVAHDCQMYNVPFTISLTSLEPGMEFYDVEAPWPEHDEAIVGWRNADNYLKVSEGDMGLHDQSFHASSPDDLARLEWTDLPDIWGNTPMHYAALRLRQQDISPDDRLKAAIVETTALNRLGYAPSAYDTALACVITMDSDGEGEGEGGKDRDRPADDQVRFWKFLDDRLPVIPRLGFPFATS